MNTKEMIAVMQAYEDGKQIECKGNGEPEENSWDGIRKPLWNWASMCYRIKATKKPVDLSVLIDSGIDCEFRERHTDWFVGKLSEIRDGHYKAYLCASPMQHRSQCRPRMNHIHTIDIGPYGDGGGELVQDLHEAGFIFDAKSTDIGNTRVLLIWNFSLADGYCYPWECDE